MEFALLTFTVSLSADETTTDRGPTGRSDSGESGDRVRLGLGVRDSLLDDTVLSMLRVCADFFERAIIFVATLGGVL